MKRTIYTTLALLLIAWLNAIVNTQNKQEDSSVPCSVGCVETKYDRFEDRTTVALPPILLAQASESAPEEGFRMTIAYSSPGKRIQRPDKVFLFFMVTDRFSRQEEPRIFKGSRSVYLLIDDISHPLGQVESLGRSEGSFLDIAYPTWRYVLEMPFEVLEKSASAKNIEIRAGTVETVFNETTKAIIRRLVKLTPKEVAPKNDVTPSIVKPPTPKRAPRRQRRRP
jgi:hypothetical protein